MRPCRGTVVTSILSSSGGTAPWIVARIDVYDRGCLRYTASRTVKCLCEQTDALKRALASATIEEMIDAMRIAPRTKFDTPEVGIAHEGVSVGCATADLPKRLRAWLLRVDAALGPLIGAGYEPLTGR